MNRATTKDDGNGKERLKKRAENWKETTDGAKNRRTPMAFRPVLKFGLSFSGPAFSVAPSSRKQPNTDIS